MGTMSDIGKYWRTIRPLRPVQIYGRLWIRLHRPRLRQSPAPPIRAAAGGIVAPARLAPSMLGPARFSFLNRSGDLSGPDPWNAADRDKLWLYNLHYFDDLNAADASTRVDWHRALIARWIADNPTGRGNGWEPYPASLRIVNWVKWALSGNALDSTWTDSLAMQARWLRQRIEWHLLGNHLLANAKALIFAGAFFDGPEADEWRAAGLSILDREIDEQILPDGGHFELSPMYHAIVLVDLLDLLNLHAAYPGLLPEAAVTQWRNAVARMRPWLTVMCHPDGEISFFNDAACGIAPKPSEIEAYADRLGLPPLAAPSGRVVLLDDSGYIRLSWGPCTVLIDVGAVGPSYLPGHAHADTLSFEWSLGDQRIVVNSGTSQYGTGPGRQAERGTAAHSTVAIDGENSSEVWGGFRVGRRAQVHDLTVREADNALHVTASHDGYAWLAGRPVHHREWILRAGELTVRDRIAGSGDHRAVARYHLAAGATGFDPGSAACAAGTIATPDGTRIGWRSSVPASAETSARHPQFGLSVPSVTLVVPLPNQACETVWRWDIGGLSSASAGGADGAGPQT